MALGQLGVLAGMFAYSRDHERDADRIGAILMHKSGYDVSEAGKVWGNLLLETKGLTERSKACCSRRTPAPERQSTLRRGAGKTYPAKKRRKWQEMSAPFLREWLADEVRRGQHEESIALLTRALAAGCCRASTCTRAARFTGCVPRRATSSFRSPISKRRPRPAASRRTHRSLGLVHRARKELPRRRRASSATWSSTRRRRTRR